MSVKGYAFGLAIGLAAVVGVAWAAKRATSNALDSAGNALTNAAGFVIALPGQAATAIGQTYTQSATLDATNYGTLADGNRQIFGIGDTGGTVAPYGKLGTWINSWLTGDPATATIPAPDVNIDYGTGNNNWND
jgi:hypothetical protein